MPVKRKIEIQTRLLAVGNHIKVRSNLVVNGGNHSVVPQLGAISFTELLKVGASELQPAGPRIAADDGCAKRAILHIDSFTAQTGVKFGQAPGVFVVGGFKNFA